MAHVAAALNTILTELNWTQRELAERCELPPSQINRYSRGVNRMPVESVAKLASAVPAEYRPTLLVAYLRDCLPEGMEKLVSIAPASAPKAEADAFELPDGMDPELRKMLQVYATLGLRHTQIRDMMRSFLRVVAPDQL